MFWKRIYPYNIHICTFVYNIYGYIYIQYTSLSTYIYFSPGSTWPSRWDLQISTETMLGESSRWDDEICNKNTWGMTKDEGIFFVSMICLVYFCLLIFFVDIYVYYHIIIYVFMQFHMLFISFQWFCRVFMYGYLLLYVLIYFMFRCYSRNTHAISIGNTQLGDTFWYDWHWLVS